MLLSGIALTRRTTKQSPSVVSFARARRKIQFTGKSQIHYWASTQHDGDEAKIKLPLNDASNTSFDNQRKLMAARNFHCRLALTSGPSCQARSLSSVSVQDDVKQIIPTSSLKTTGKVKDRDEAASARSNNTFLRRRRMNDRRKKVERRKRIKKQQSQRDISMSKLPVRSFQEIADFADYLTRTFPSKSLQPVLMTLQALVAATCENDDAELPLATVFQTLLHATNPNKPAQLAILKFLLQPDREGDVKSAGLEDVGEDDTVAVQTMVAARQRAAANDLQWSQAHRRDTTIQLPTVEKQLASLATKSLEFQQQDAREFLKVLRESMPLKPYYNTLRLFEMYNGEKAVSDDADESSIDFHDNDDDEESTSDVESPVDASRPFRMRNLSSHLAQRAGAHFYLVAEPAASYFGLRHVKMEKVAKYNRAKIKLEKLLHKTTTTLTDLQQKLQESLGFFSDDEEDDDDDDNIDDDDESVEDLDMAVQQELTDAIVHETDDLLKRSARAKIVSPLINGDQRFRRGSHIKYDVVQLRENSHLATDISTPPVDRMVFLDNLPIDITTDRLIELYSRCGDVASVTIYNQRPDLDPGPLTIASLRARRKKQYKVAGAQNRRWQRPRSPVYAELTFSDAAGHRACCIDELRIFGMIVQMHPIRSLRASDMTSLFVENIPDKTFCIDFEEILNGIVREGLFATAAAGENRRAIVGSCEIKFPSFEISYESFHKLLESDLLQNRSDSAVHWFRTPFDAEAWWKRKRGFD
ncbi:hypothetical protein MPSEU_000536500 [Mayamaea pseudoterrestris]|nr:hypothetical protein MPSEU_000536500 [Mayamaea pseudoterrestris]